MAGGRSQEQCIPGERYLAEDECRGNIPMSRSLASAQVTFDVETLIDPALCVAHDPAGQVSRLRRRRRPVLGPWIRAGVEKVRKMCGWW